MSSAPTVKAHVTTTPGVCGGKPCISGTRVRVQDIVIRNEMGESPDEIVAALPHITVADVHGALAYYYDNREEIDRQIRESEEFVTQLKAQAGPGLLDQISRHGGGNAPISS